MTPKKTVILRPRVDKGYSITGAAVFGPNKSAGEMLANGGTDDGTAARFP